MLCRWSPEDSGNAVSTNMKSAETLIMMLLFAELVKMIPFRAFQLLRRP